MKPFRSRVVNHREKVTADPIHVWLDQPHDGVGGNGGIDRVPTSLEDPDTGLRCERLTRGDYPVLRGDLRAACDNIHAVCRVHRALGFRRWALDGLWALGCRL